MIDFTKKIHLSDKFRQPALTYIRTGLYCLYPKGTSEYMNYWSTELDRCINGYTADDGDFISGYNYFYLNYCPILRIVNKEVNGKVKAVSEVTFPDFWDYDYYYFLTVEEAQLQGKHLCVLKSRRRGYSYKAASMMCRNYYLVPNTSSYVYASNKQYLTDDGVLTKAWNYMDFIDENTAWGKKRTVNTQLRRRAGMWVKDEYGNLIEVGYKSEIIGVTLKDNPDVGHPYDQIVYTPEGKKKWEDITIGSKLFDSRGGITTVTEVNELGKVPVYRLTLSDGRIVEATADHKWRIFRYRHKQHSWNGKNEKREIREIELTTEEIFELTKNKSYKTNRCRIKTRFSVPFNRQEVPIDAYTMGFLLGDGSLTKTSNHKAYFVQSAEDYESIKHLFPYKIDKQYGITYAVNIPNAKLIVKDLGLLDKTSDNKFIPDCYKYNCEEIRIAVLNGLLDTDGSITKDYGVIEYVSKSYQLARDVRWLLFSLGINNSLHIKYIKGTPYYRVYIYCSGEEHRLFCIPRKKERISIKKLTPFALSKVQYTYIDKVEKIEDKISKCVTVDAEDRVYMIGDFIETKNCRGKRANLILFEEAGSFKELSAAWQIARPSVEIDGRAFATMIAYGTGGDEESNFFTLKDMFYHPEGYNCLALPNIWDENVSNTSCGFFVPLYTNMDLRDDQGKRLYMDKDGNTLTIPARQYILEERRKVIENSTNSVAVDRYVAERPITPAEACLEFNGNIFPKKELQEQLGKIRTNKLLSNHKQIGDLIWESDGSLKWLLKKNGDITHYPLNKNDDPTGSIVIWEHPVKDAPVGLYIMGCLTPGEKVLTDKGLVNVEDVDFSYKLINRYGEYDRIINLLRYNKINEPVFRIKPTGSYRTTLFTGEHPILLSNNTFVKAKDLKVGDELIIPNRYTVIKNDYLTIIEEELGVDPNNPKLWRFLGIWLGDGFNNINRNSYDIYVAFGKDLIDLANKYSELVLEVFNRKTIWCKSNGGQTRRFTNKKLVEFLNKYFGKYAENKRIPEWAMYLPEDLKRSFIIGYLDSDGSVFKDRAHYKVTFTSVNLSLLELILQLLYSIRICSSITLKLKAGNYTINNKTQHKLDAYCLKIASQDTLLLLDNSDKVEVGFKLGLLYNYDRTQLSKRPRYAKISEDGKSIYLKIQKIDQSLYTGIVYNFECESHTYMCHDIVSHNCDPYDHDLSGTNSLGSCFVYKRFLNFENYYDLIVAEYTGRPSTAEEFYENVRKLAIYYNARIMYENQNKGLFPYFVAKHCDYLLADLPDILNDIIGNSKVNRKKGCHMNKLIKLWGEGLIKDWLNDEKAPGHKNLHDILSEPLLEELISYNDIGNFDRCLTKDTLITTESGYKKVQDIKVGDKVLTHTGLLKSVTWIDKHIHNEFKAKLRLIGDYRTLECTDNHPILVAYTDKVKHNNRVKALNNIQYLRADLLTYKYQFGLLPKRKLNKQIDLSADILYVLGWIMSDGYVPKTSFGVKITFQGNQLEEAKRCLTIIEDYLKDEDYYIDNNHRRLKRKPTRIESFKNGVFKHEIIVHSRKLHDLALWFGCEANNKHINDEVYNSYNNLMPFVIGWLEGDGHQRLNVNYDGYTRNGIELSTIYEKLIHQCRLILLDSGIYSSIRKVPSRRKNHLTQYSILISNEYINKLLDFYPSLKYCKITVNRNTSKVLETTDGFWVPIKLLGLEKINEEVYNFEVQDDHTYIANGIATHNCMALILVMIYREQLYNVVVKEKKKQNKNRLLFDGPIFNEDSWYDDIVNNVEEDVYTFN